MTPPPSLQVAREILADLSVKARSEADAIDLVLHSLADTEAKLAMDLDRRVPAPTQSHALDYHPHPLDRRYSGPPVSSWATGDGVRHRFDDRSHSEYDTSGWTAFCGVSLENAMPRPDPVDCDRCDSIERAATGPFCGHADKIEVAAYPDGRLVAQCGGCGARGPRGDLLGYEPKTQREVTAHWNRRHAQRLRIAVAQPSDPAFCRHGLDFDGGLASDGCKTSWRPGDSAPDLTRGESWRCRRSDARVVQCALAAGHTGDCWAP